VVKTGKTSKMVLSIWVLFQKQRSKYQHAKSVSLMIRDASKQKKPAGENLEKKRELKLCKEGKKGGFAD